MLPLSPKKPLSSYNQGRSACGGGGATLGIACLGQMNDVGQGQVEASGLAARTI